MSRKTEKLLSTLLISVIIIAATLSIAIVHAPENAILKIEPSSKIDPAINPCTTLVFNATLTNVTDLYNWQITVYFKPSVLNCTNAWIPADSPFNFPIKAPIIIDNNEGWVTLGASKLGAVPGVNGSGILGCIEFHVLSRGTSDIYYSKPYGEDTFLADHNMQKMYNVTVQDGYFSNWVPPPPATIYVNPKRIVDPTLGPCNDTSVDVNIINATDVYAWKAKLFYRNDILNATAVTEGDFLKTGGSTTFQAEILRDYNSTHGRIKTNCTLIGSVSGVSGNGTLATISFHVIGWGESALTLDESAIYDPEHTLLPLQKAHGYFNNLLIGKLSVEPPEVSGPEYVPCTTFTINITLDDVEYMRICIFNLSYNPDVLSISSFTVHKVQGLNPTKKVTWDDEAGFIWVNLTYPAPYITTYSPVTLVTLEFHVEALGISPLDLHDTELTDSAGQPIFHEVYDGIFIGLIRDVAVVDVTPDRTIAYQSWKVYINVTVRNEGNITETFDVKAYYDGNLIGTLPVANLAQDEERTITFTWDTSSATPCHNYTISAEALAVPYEADLSDNTKTDGTVKIKIMGDIDGNGKADMFDLGLACSAFGSTPSHPRWNPDADLDLNGKIDMFDIALIVINFGKSC